MRPLPPRSAGAFLLAALLAACATTTPTPRLGPSGFSTPPAIPWPTSAEPTPSTPVVRTSIPHLTRDALADRIVRTGLERHLVAFQAIADANDGHRATSSAGFAASLAHARDALEAAGYDVELRSFTVDGIEGTNLLVERPGSETDVVMLGGHLDSVAVGPGLNDNGSGVAAVLAIAEALAQLPAPGRTIRLALWDAEEGGPFGSRAYLDALSSDERGRIVAYLNLDMIGSPNALRLVYDEADAAEGSDAITDDFAAHFDAAGLPWEPIDLDGDSDHGPFTDAGIPTGGLFSGGFEPVTDAQADRFGATAGAPADPCSHRPCDTIDNVDLDTLLEMTRAVAVTLLALADLES